MPTRNEEVGLIGTGPGVTRGNGGSLLAWRDCFQVSVVQAGDLLEVMDATDQLAADVLNDVARRARQPL